MITVKETLHCDLCGLPKEEVVLEGNKRPDGWGSIKASILNGGEANPLVGKTGAFNDVCPTCLKRVAKKLMELHAQ